MSIAIITPGAFPVPPIRGGSVEIAVNGLGQELSKHVRTLIFSRKVGRLSAIEQQGNRIDIRIPFRSVEQYLREVDTFIAKEQPACLQIENRPLYVLHFKKKWPQLKLILSLHSLTFIQALPHRSAFRALSASDLLIVNSKFIKKEIRRLFPELTTKVKVRYLGINENTFFDRFSARGEALRLKYRNRYNLQGKQILLFVGRLIPEKGLHLVLESLPALIQSHPNIHLVIVGSSHYGRQSPTAYVKKLKTLVRPIAKHVTFTNFISPKLIPEIYHVADIVVTPSIGKEAFCLVNLEASISGIPVISTDVGGISEVIKHAENGFLIHPKSWESQFIHYTSLLLNDKELNQSMGKNGQTLAHKQFSWRKSCRRYLRSYQSLQPILSTQSMQELEIDQRFINHDGDIRPWENPY